MPQNPATLEMRGFLSMPEGETLTFLPKFFSSSSVQALSDTMDREKCCGIKRPDYLFEEEALLNIKRVQGSITKLIVTVRDPVARSVSHFYHLRRYAQVKFCSFDEFVKYFEEKSISSIGDRAPEIYRYSRISKALERAQEIFGKNNVLLVQFEDIVDKPQQTMKIIYDFLDVRSGDLPKFKQIPQKVGYSEKYQFFWAASARMAGYCENKIVVDYRPLPLPVWRSVGIRLLQLLARQYLEGEKRGLFRCPRFRWIRHYREGMIAADGRLSLAS